MSLKLLAQLSNSIETVNVELNLQTMFHLSGQKVDIDRVKEITKILEEANDPRAEKGKKLLESL